MSFIMFLWRTADSDELSLCVCSDTASAKLAWTRLKRSSSALANTSQTWTSAPSFPPWPRSSCISARTRRSASTAFPVSFVTMTPTSVTLTRPFSRTVLRAWPSETLPTNTVEVSGSWLRAPTRTCLSSTPTGSCGSLPTFLSHTPFECWTSTSWKATRCSTGLCFHTHTGPESESGVYQPRIWCQTIKIPLKQKPAREQYFPFRVALALLSLYRVSVSSRVADVEDFRTDMKRFVRNVARHCTAESLLERAFTIPIATRKELNLLFNANKDSLMQKGVSIHQKRWIVFYTTRAAHIHVISSCFVVSEGSRSIRWTLTTWVPASWQGQRWEWSGPGYLSALRFSVPLSSSVKLKTEEILLRKYIFIHLALEHISNSNDLPAGLSWPFDTDPTGQSAPGTMDWMKMYGLGTQSYSLWGTTGWWIRCFHLFCLCYTCWTSVDDSVIPPHTLQWDLGPAWSRPGSSYKSFKPACFLHVAAAWQRGQGHWQKHRRPRPRCFIHSGYLFHHLGFSACSNINQKNVARLRSQSAYQPWSNGEGFVSPPPHASVTCPLSVRNNCWAPSPRRGNKSAVM